MTAVKEMLTGHVTSKGEVLQVPQACQYSTSWPRYRKQLQLSNIRVPAMTQNYMTDSRSVAQITNVRLEGGTREMTNKKKIRRKEIKLRIGTWNVHTFLQAGQIETRDEGKEAGHPRYIRNKMEGSGDVRSGDYHLSLIHI